MKKSYWAIIGMVILVIVILLILLIEKNDVGLLLNGDTLITINQNESYVEPGYEIKGNNKDEYYVKVENDVNTKVPGAYIIRYYLYNKENIVIYETTREIRVMEEKDDLIFTLNGNTREYFFMEDYIELGAKASKNGVDLSSNITINSNVNDKVTGDYQVVYELVDNSVKNSITRNVKIIDLDVLENIDYNNKKISLRLNTENYDYTLLPNNTKDSSTQIYYPLSGDLSYIFDVYLKSGSHKKYVVTIKNTSVPTGTCTITTSNSNTVVTINSYDENGILKYSYNGIDYYANSFVINGIQKNIQIRVYNKLNNHSDISCNAKIDTGYKTFNLSNTYPICNTNWSNANTELDNLMQFYGYRTRDAVVAAALYLTNFNYKIGYSWGGKYLEKGLNPKWGCKTEVTKMVCSNQIGSNTCELGLDCSGFTAWAYAQAGFDKNILVTHAQSTSMWGNFDASKHKYSFRNNQDKVNLIKVGDIVQIEGHVGIVVGMDDKTLQVANEREGIRISIINKTNGKSINNDKDFENFVLFDDFFKMYGN